mmetsp:Transcript_54029/g.118227  ORF Transcript_54029/g.118227 Transcript_54029/m.118227 type:complete len:265 (+) Transcript_54029:59-853(+)
MFLLVCLHLPHQLHHLEHVSHAHWADLVLSAELINILAKCNSVHHVAHLLLDNSSAQHQGILLVTLHLLGQLGGCAFANVEQHLLCLLLGISFLSRPLPVELKLLLHAVRRDLAEGASDGLASLLALFVVRLVDFGGPGLVLLVGETGLAALELCKQSSDDEQEERQQRRRRRPPASGSMAAASGGDAAAVVAAVVAFAVAAHVDAALAAAAAGLAVGANAAWRVQPKWLASRGWSLLANQHCDAAKMCVAVGKMSNEAMNCLG